MNNTIFRSRLVDEDEEILKENLSLQDLIQDLPFDKRQAIQRLFVYKQSEVDRLIREINMIKSEKKTLDDKDDCHRDKFIGKYNQIVKKIMDDANELNKIHMDAQLNH